jgi:hypothetical protein
MTRPRPQRRDAPSRSTASKRVAEARAPVNVVREKIEPPAETPRAEKDLGILALSRFLFLPP